MRASGCERRYAWGRKSARRRRRCMTRRYPVVPETYSGMPERKFDHGAVTVRQPPVPPDGYRFAIACAGI